MGFIQKDDIAELVIEPVQEDIVNKAQQEEEINFEIEIQPDTEDTATFPAVKNEMVQPEPEKFEQQYSADPEENVVSESDSEDLERFNDEEEQVNFVEEKVAIVPQETEIVFERE